VVCVFVCVCVSAHDTKGVDRVQKRQVRTIKIRVKIFGTDGEESSSSAHVHTGMVTREGGRERNRLKGAGKRVTHRPFCG
jgi:hypothetical protein